MPGRLAMGGVFGVLLAPAAALANGGVPLNLPWWSGVPFALLLLTIAVLPLVAGHFWESNRNKALIAAVLSAPVALYLVAAAGGAGGAALLHELGQYASFIVLLGVLYTIAGGIGITGHPEGTPLTNTLMLLAGAAVANLIGTTGASMLFIRPFLHINRERAHVRHIPVFFIFTVSNLGGLLTPLADPPLFLGFLNGVPFDWTLRLWPQWLMANAIVLSIFFVWDMLAFRRESATAIAAEEKAATPLHVRGTVNFLLLAGVVAAVLLQSDAVGQGLGQRLGVGPLTLQSPWAEMVLLGMAGLSLWLTPGTIRAANGFNWGAITEVAVLFAGIFVTMTPVLALVQRHGPELGVSQPWQYFWLTGGLSAFLDNAPTYLMLGTLAAGQNDMGWLAANEPRLLEAISCGAVFMGAATYLGNGPNFMVKAIAEEAGFRTPSFFGYMAYSAAVLLPVYVLLTFLFFA